MRVVLFAAVLVAMASIATFNPILGLLSRGLGFTEIQSGSLVTVTGICWIVGSFIWSRRAGSSRKPILIAAMAGYALTLVAFAYVTDRAQTAGWSPGLLYAGLLALRAAGGFCFGAIPSLVQAYLMESTGAESRAGGMALFGAANGLGFVLGPALGAALTPFGFTAPMYASAILLAAVIVLCGWMLPRGKAIIVASGGDRLSVRDPRIRLYLGIGLLLSTVMIVLQVTCGIYMQDRLGVDAPSAARMVGIGLSVGGVIVVAVQLFIGRRLTWKPNRVVRTGLFALLAAFTLFMVAPSLYLAVFVLFGLGIGFTLPGYMTAASLAVQEREQAAVAGFTAAAQGVGSFIGPVTGAALYAVHISLPYAICALVLLVFYVRVVWLSRKPEVRLPGQGS
ncbi:MFS transporter [Paenibacillus filicis]|uniref:MFS transporter n=1 Tax=Paenibacillus filicis TaxID=669464 RepID=A0ABU9DSG2_9BACL